eukprot:7043239-Prorocentrum_lima.AAC.1
MGRHVSQHVYKAARCSRSPDRLLDKPRSNRRKGGREVAEESQRPGVSRGQSVNRHFNVQNIPIQPPTRYKSPLARKHPIRGEG